MTKRSPKASRIQMKGYGLPEHNKGLLPWKWADERLAKSHNYWVTTVRGDGRPHTMVVWGLWLANVFYFSTGRESQKSRNLRSNPNCVVCNELAHEAVIVEGVAREVRKSEARKRFFRLYERKYKFDMAPYEKEPIWAAHPVKVFGLDEKLTLNRATRWIFSGPA
jgi:nitroimidazol reductase NimA-like FMN-containing flavoprotein (pyridoxamine 5'-phosphate oxidase superfamily)